MATAKQEAMAKNLLEHSEGSGGGRRHPRKQSARKPQQHLRAHRQLVSLSEEELSRREQGWNDRFSIEPPPKCNKLQPSSRSPTSSNPPTTESKIRDERVQYGTKGHRDGKRQVQAPKKPSSGRLMPLGGLSKPPSEATQSTKEERLRFKVLKAIDARETLLYQLSALILCTPVQESLFLPSRPTDPPAATVGGRQQLRSRGGMALSTTPLSRQGGSNGAMTNSREATKLAQQLATDLQVSGIQCVEALVEWMLEAGAQAENPPPFLWRGRNYFLKMISDLDFAQTELQTRGVNLECFMQQNPLLIRPNQKLGRVLAAHSIIMEMVEFAKVLTPMELLALSSRIRDSDRTERQPDAVASKPILGVAQLGADILLERDCGTERSSMRGETNTDRMNNNHEDCATELVNILDENLDFILARPSRKPNLPRGELANVDNKFGVDEEEFRSKQEEAEPTLNEDTPADEFEGSAQVADAFPSKLGSAAMETPMDNQSDYEESSGDEGDDGEDLNNDPDAAAPQSPQALVTTVALSANDDQDKEPEQGSHPLLVDNVLANEDPANTPSLDGVAASDHDQNSARTEDYDNSFDDDAGASDPPQELGINALPEDATSGVASSEQEGRDEPDESVEGEDKNGLLDENEADAGKAFVEPAASSEQPLSGRSDSSNQSDYDNSFADDADDADEGDGHTEVDPVESQLPSESTTEEGGATAMIDEKLGAEDVGGSNDPSIHDTKHGDHPPQTDTELPVSETDDSPRGLPNKLVDELQRWSLLQDVTRPTESEVQRCLSWHKTLALATALQSHSLIADAMESSLLSLLSQYELAVPQQPLKSLLGSDVALELELAKCLGEECRSIVDEICSVLAEDMQRSLGRQNSLVSEIELTEVVEVAQTTRQEQQESTWKCLKSAATLVAFLRTCATEGSIHVQSRSAPSAGFSRLLKVFYPYLVNQPREELRANWLAVSRELGVMGLNVEQLSFLLDPVCKALLLTVRSADAFSHEASGSDDPESSVIFPKITVVCAREDVLQSSVEYVSRKGLLTDGAPSSVSLFPFFKSSFGEKLVDGVKVEEGEGKGPLKEWFSLVGLQMASKWKRIFLDSFVKEEPSDQITVSGNAITVPGVAHLIFPGFQLEWEGSDGETVSRVVNKSVEESTFLLDRGVALSQSFPASQLRVSQPRTALFEYLQASESYWPNEQTRDSPENHNTLVFVGWFLASAIGHYSSIQLPIHPLFFRLLLRPQYRVTLADLQAFNSSLFESLLQLKKMKPADFEAYLKFEGADAGLSVAAYINQVLEDKFGSASGVGWQLEAVRQGFTRVVSLEQIRGLGIDAEDLVDIVCGGSSSRGSHDFAINEVFRVAADSDFSDCQPLTNAFWQTVNGFDPLLKRKFIKFVTGVDTLPLAGTEFLRIEMPFAAISAADQAKCLQTLPQAHTCDNTLELPHYWKALCWRDAHDEQVANSSLEKELRLLVDKKLRDAVEYSSGYGLDGTSAVAGVLFEKALADDAFQLAKEESYDSMGLPALAEGQSDLDQQIESPQPSPTKAVEERGLVEGEVPANAMSPRQEESYEENDWEEEEL